MSSQLDLTVSIGHCTLASALVLSVALYPLKGNPEHCCHRCGREALSNGESGFDPLSLELLSADTAVIGLRMSLLEHAVAPTHAGKQVSKDTIVGEKARMCGASGHSRSCESQEIAISCHTDRRVLQQRRTRRSQWFRAHECTFVERKCTHAWKLLSSLQQRRSSTISSDLFVEFFAAAKNSAAPHWHRSE